VSACSVPIGLYHDAEGGAIAQDRQPPPGEDLPYPNLASVPAAPPPTAPGTQAAINAQVQRTGPDVSPASAQALEGLALPDAPPPIPGIAEPTPSAAAAASAPPPAPPAPPVKGAAIALAFPADSALLTGTDATTLATIATTRGSAGIIVGGFAPENLPLAIARAARLADSLTAAGVPAGAIRMLAAASGSGGFVQLVY
jgi:hypothetical protein